MLNLFLLLNLAYATEVNEKKDPDLDFVTIQAEESAPFSGYLFTDEALTNLISQHRGELLAMNIDHETNMKLLEEDLNYKHSLDSLKWESKEQMYLDLIKIRDDQIKKSENKDIIQRVAFFGGFVLGSAITIGITYSVNQN